MRPQIHRIRAVILVTHSIDLKPNICFPLSVRPIESDCFEYLCRDKSLTNLIYGLYRRCGDNLFVYSRILGQIPGDSGSNLDLPSFFIVTC
jgi:hypothetical protein